MKVAILCIDDWANVSYNIELCLKNVGIEVKSFKQNKHIIEYPNQSLLFSESPNWKDWVNESNIIMFIHSRFIETGIELKKKKIYVEHTGSAYRHNSKKINKIFNPIVNASLVGGDLLGMGAKNEIWVLGPIDTESFSPIYRTDFSKPLIIGHYPSGPKGTEIILEAFKKIPKNDRFIFKYDQKNVSWNNQIERMSGCDIYAGCMMEKQKWKSKGTQPLYVFGTTMLESACLGKIGINRFPLKNQYEKLFGKCSIINPLNAKELEKVINNLIELSDQEILQLQKESREWVERCHSLKVVGKRYKKIFEET